MSSCSVATTSQDEPQHGPGPRRGNVRLLHEREPDLAGSVAAGADLLVRGGAHRHAALSEDPQTTPRAADVGPSYARLLQGYTVRSAAIKVGEALGHFHALVVARTSSKA